MTETPVDLGIEGLGPAVLVGQGGSGRVYRARQSHLDRDVAVKIVPTGGDAGVARRFERERRAMGRLSQVDGILAVHDAGIRPDGDLYLITPYLEGGSLQDYVSTHGKMSWDSAAPIMATVARALQGAHDQGIVHRDVKPGNILLDAKGRPLLADFGIARLGLDTTATSSAISLTPAYSAPEAFDDTEGSVLSDVYSLGTALWALIAGRAPFTDAERSTPLGSLVGRIMTQPIGDLRNVAPEGICRAIEAATAKDPVARPPTAAAFADMLDQALAGHTSTQTGVIAPRPPVDPASATPTGDYEPETLPASQQAEPGRDNRRLIAVVLAVLVLGGGVAAAVLAVSGGGDSSVDSVETADTETAETSREAGETVEPTPTTDEVEPVPTAVPTPTPIPLVLEFPTTALTAGLDWLLSQPELAAGTSERLGAVPCESVDFSLTHCYDGPAAVDSGQVLVFASTSRTPEFSLLIVPSGSGSDWQVAETYTVPIGDDPFARPFWYNDYWRTEANIDAQVAERGYSDPVQFGVSCGSATVGGTVKVGATKTLFARTAPRDGDVILDLGPNYRVSVFENDIAEVDGAAWYLIRLPVESWGCGWVSSSFVDTDVPLLAEDEPEPTPVSSEGYGLATCRSGYQLVFGGTTKGDEFDVAVCATRSGAIEYHGVRVSDGADLRGGACELSEGIFEVMADGWTYTVLTGSTRRATLEIESPTNDVTIESFDSVRNNRGSGLQAC